MESVSRSAVVKTFIFVLGLILLALVASAYAGDEPAPPSADPVYDAKLQACYERGAQQAWGATMRYNDAERKIILVEVKDFISIFSTVMEHTFENSLHLPGILLAVDPDEQRHEERARNAMFGWDAADKLFIPNGETNPGYTMLLARFADFCKSQIK